MILDLNSATASLTGVSTFGALAAVGSDTLTVRSLGQSSDARLLGFGRKGATAGMCRLRSPFLHDPTNGIRSRVLAATPESVWDPEYIQLMRGQDPLTFESTGGAAAEQESGWLLIAYPTLAGSETSLFISSAELKARAAEWVTNENPVTGGAGATWGSALLSAGTGELKANQLYAVAGFTVDVACTAVGITGPDTGNFRTGWAGVADPYKTRRIFVDLSEWSGLPTIPVINAQNASGTSIFVVDSAGATAVNVDLLLARLKGR